MAIEINDIKVIISSLKSTPINKKNLLILGECIFHFNFEELDSITKKLNYKLNINPSLNYSEINIYEFGSMLGFENTETLDINGKADLNVDLTLTLPSHLINKYDLIIDSGVLFWCFDPTSALKNIYMLSNNQSIIIHTFAITGHFGRGFFNIHPLFFEKFYSENDCEYIYGNIRSKPIYYFNENDLISLLFQYLIKTLQKIKLLNNECSINFNIKNFKINSKFYWPTTFKIMNCNSESMTLPNDLVATISFKKLCHYSTVKLPKLIG